MANRRERLEQLASVPLFRRMLEAGAGEDRQGGRRGHRRGRPGARHPGRDRPGVLRDRRAARPSVSRDGQEIATPRATATTSASWPCSTAAPARPRSPRRPSSTCWCRPARVLRRCSTEVPGLAHKIMVNLAERVRELDEQRLRLTPALEPCAAGRLRFRPAPWAATTLQGPYEPHARQRIQARPRHRHRLRDRHRCCPGISGWVVRGLAGRPLVDHPRGLRGHPRPR